MYFSFSYCLLLNVLLAWYTCTSVSSNFFCQYWRLQTFLLSR